MSAVAGFTGVTVAGVSGVLEIVMSEDLDAILTGEDGAEEAEQPRDETGKFAAEETPEVTEEAVESKGVETTEEVADESPSSEEPKVEDNVRAGLEAELARIRAKNRELEARVNKPVEPERPDFFEDPDAALMSVEQRVDQKIARAKIDWSEQAARQRHEDFDSKIEVFTELANEDPRMWEQMTASPDPAEFAYKQANQVIKMREFENIGSFEEKIRAEERAKAEKLAAEKYEAKLKELSSLPGSLSDTRATGGNSSPPVTDESLEDVLGR